jgi:MFS family permease
MAAGRDLPVLVAARVFMGLGAGMCTPALRRIVILSDAEHLGHNLGRVLAADVVGFAVGPAISAVLVGPFGVPAPFIVIAVATAACLPFLVALGVQDERSAAPAEARFAFDLLRIRPYAGAVCMGMAVFVMIGTFDALWVLVLDDLHASDLIANVGIVVFVVPLVLLGSLGGRLAQRIGPFRLGTVGLLLGAGYMFSYGQLPSGGLMLTVAIVHAFSDGLTVTSSGVAVGLTTPADRQAGAQGLLGGAQTLVGGLFSLLAGMLYEHHGRAVAYGTCAVAMSALVVTALALAGPDRSISGAPAERAPDHGGALVGS